MTDVTWKARALAAERAWAEVAEAAALALKERDEWQRRWTAVVGREKALLGAIDEAVEMMGREISNGTDWVGVDGDPNHALAILRCCREVGS